MLQFINLLFLIFTFSMVSTKNNVCPSDLDYYTIDLNLNCWYDPDVDASIPEIINNHGFNSKSYNVTTWDGYILEIFRIPSKLNETVSKPKSPILLFPGLLRDARCMLILGEDSPAIYYAKQGYDVWIANRRGTEYSNHIKYTKDDKEFWNFSFHEMGSIDVPTIVEKVAEVSKQPGNIIYIGHSMGTTASYIYCTLNSSHCANNLKAIISLAPIAKINHTKTPLLHIISLLESEIKVALNTLGIHRLEIDWLFKICQGAPFTSICAGVIEFFTGLSEPNIFPRIMPIFSAHGNTPASVKVITHYGQIIKNQGKFRQYDYGLLKNLEKYQSILPPTYNLFDIPVNVTLIYANYDLLSSKTDVEDLYSNLHPDRRFIVEIPRNGSAKYLSHMDFFLAANIEEVLYPEITNALVK
ncbi:unnamed protein product [Brassicogethes aeneus]|uniref:Lipase n=1 Tax=Brassicogethes aeneus TaxID=1431903 RepID=A0A9P0BEH1_BRAAE|nr:unnamed protein product [Brassicogethes aeneus]